MLQCYIELRQLPCSSMLVVSYPNGSFVRTKETQRKLQQTKNKIHARNQWKKGQSRMKDPRVSKFIIGFVRDFQHFLHQLWRPCRNQRSQSRHRSHCVGVFFFGFTAEKNDFPFPRRTKKIAHVSTTQAACHPRRSASWKYAKLRPITKPRFENVLLWRWQGGTVAKGSKMNRIVRSDMSQRFWWLKY